MQTISRHYSTVASLSLSVALTAYLGIQVVTGLVPPTL